MLYGGFIEYKGQPVTLIFAAKSTQEMVDLIADISIAKNNYVEITQPSAMDRIKMRELVGIKNPLTFIVHESESQRDDFVKANQIEILHRSGWEYYQEKMHKEDEIIQIQDTKELTDLDALSGVIHHTSIAKELGIDEVDQWDTRTEKEKAEDLLNSSGMVARMVEQGLLTDEAVAPADEQAGSMEAAVLNLVEHIKGGGKMIDPNNIPPIFQKQIDDLIASGELKERDVSKFIDDLNKKVKDLCENDKLDEIMRIFGNVNVDATGTDGRIFINTKKVEKKEITGPDSEIPDIEKKLLSGKSQDELNEILKPAAVDGNLKSDGEKWIFDNTSLDKYDLADVTETVKNDSDAKLVSFDESKLPENIGENSDITYADAKEYAFHAIVVDEDAGVFGFFPKGLGIEIDPENVIGTNNIKDYLIVNGCFLFTLKDKEYKTAYLVIKDRNTIVFNINV